jgi:hypothetical protein
MRQTVKTATFAPMKLSEPLLVGTLVMLLVGFNIAAGSRSTTHTALPGLSLFQSSVTAPAHNQVASIDE